MENTMKMDRTGTNTAMNANSVFERYEQKFLVSPAQYVQLTKAVEQYMVSDGYGLHTICTVYFDTEDFSVIRHSLDKPAFKEKLRLRSYGVPGDTDCVYLELKKKLRGITYKRRMPMAYRQARDYMYKGIIPDLPAGQIFGEIDWYMKQKSLGPKAVICYDRLAYTGLDGGDLRITLDSGLRWRGGDVDLGRGDYGEQLLRRGERLMEVKTLNSLPLWLCGILSELKIFPISFSKYGRVYTAHLIQQWKEEIKYVG